MKQRNFLLVFSLLWAGMMSAQTATDTVYVFLEDQADAGYFLPAPPDTASMDYVDDLLQWQWGKTPRNFRRLFTDRYAMTPTEYRNEITSIKQ